MALNYAELRQKMVDNQIRTIDVTNLSVLEAFLTVPKEDFVPDNIKKLSYIDGDLIVCEAEAGKPARYIMESAPLAKLLQVADIDKNAVVLDIGSSTGYCAALLSQLSNSVIALESDKVLVEFSIAALEKNHCDNVVVINGPLDQGYASEGPYDVILIEGAVDFVPQAILDQLKEGGRLVVVEGHGNAGAVRIYLKEDAVFSHRFAFNLAIKPMAGFLKTQEFIF